MKNIMIVKEIKSIGSDEGGKRVVEANLILTNDVVTIQGEDLGFDSRHETIENLPKYNGQMVSLEIELFLNREKPLFRINNATKKIEPYKFIEGEIIAKLQRKAKPPNGKEILVTDIFIECGVIAEVHNVSDEFDIGDYVHADGYFIFHNVIYQGIVKILNPKVFHVH